MRKRIRNILIEALVLESPLFRAVAVKCRGEIFEGEPYDFHWDVKQKIVDKLNLEVPEDLGMSWEDVSQHLEMEDGFITLNGNFVTREDAAKMIHQTHADSEDMRHNRELVEA